MAVAHYLEALDFQKEIVKIHTIFGGKNPHPNWLVGGVPCAINVDDTGAVGAINMERLNLVSRDHRPQSIEFIDQVYLPDLHGDRLVLQGLDLRRRPVGEVRDVLRRHSRRRPTTTSPRTCCCRAARSSTATSTKSTTSTCASPQRDPGVRHPLLVHATPTRRSACIPGTASPSRTSTSGRTPRARRTRIEAVDESAKYSWIKAPRWNGHAMEVGPLARYIDRLRAGHARSSRSRRTSCSTELGAAADGAVLDAGPHRGARPRGAAGRRTS